ncbi:neuronal acetylcholine receptor subunit alpha-4-like [Clytia hemisphaerica]|uniref:Uncharacterized protein n=1 Tax=Clytia hemisphaerica TaxID=252671 RepID=A0A7M5X3J0_9CNID|eukprot:TCONS_00060248-protein
MFTIIPLTSQLFFNWKSMKLQALCWSFLLSWLQFAVGLKMSNTPREESIHTELFTNYNANVKPDGLINNTVQVHLDVTVLKLSFLDIRSQVLSIQTFTTLRWFDKRLMWDPKAHHDITQISVPNSLLWTPDIVLYNDADNDYTTHNEIYRTNVQIHHKGMLTWTSNIEWKANCEVDITWFPLDKQVCNLLYGSLSYTSEQLSLVLREKVRNIDGFVKRGDRNFVQSGEWDVKDINIKSVEQKFPCCRDNFSALSYTVALSRFPQFYFLYMFFPIFSQFFLFLMVFHIRPESGERLGFGITILLNITMFMTFISEKLPEKSNNRPLIGLLFSVLFFIYSLGLALASMTTFFSSRLGPVPHWLRKFAAPAATEEAFIVENQTSENIEDEEINTTKDGPKIQTISRGSNSEVTWAMVMRSLDKYLFYIFLVISVLLPIIIGLSLDQNFFAGWKNIFNV